MQSDIRKLLGELWAEVEAASIRTRTERAKADPHANRYSKIFPKGANYRYYPGATKRETFCYSVHPNAAGYWMAWRETVDAKGNGRRDQWVPSKTKRGAIEHARHGSEKARREPTIG